ncbi:MAG: hypothetical protein IJY04_01270 [Clostridia bacterium]|nr:hypothetical protein [Clostridia bacterium]
MAVISTYGNAAAFTTSALMGMGATSTNANGRFYIDGSMVNVELSRVIADAIYIQEIFRNGQSVNAGYVTGQRQGGAVRVMLDTPLPFSSRTLSYGGRAGTENNGGFYNRNAPILPASDEFIVHLDQINDQDMVFPDLAAQYLPLDVVAKKVANYSSRVAMDRSASTLAEILAYSIFRALNGGDNLVNQGTLTDDNAYAVLVNNLNSKLDNGDPVRGAFTFPTEGRTIIGRPGFVNNVFSKNSGLILTGGDLAQEMLRNYDLDRTMDTRDYVGTGYRGYAMNFHWQIAPDYIWSLAEKYLGLTAGALNNVSAIAVSFDATATATNIDLGVQMLPAQYPQPRGTIARPLNIWGHEAFRKSYIIGDSTLTTSYLTTTAGFSASVRRHPCAPAVANLGVDGTPATPIYGNANGVVGYVPEPNGDNINAGEAPEA